MPSPPPARWRPTIPSPPSSPTSASSPDKSERLARSGDKEAAFRADVLGRCKALLNQARPVRQLALNSADEKKLVKTLGLITAKKVLYVANVDELDIHGQGPMVEKVRARAAAEG